MANYLLKIKIPLVLFLLILLVGLGISTVRWSDASRVSYHGVPDYEKTLKTVVLTLGVNDADLRWHIPLLRALPQYTEVILLVPEIFEAQIRTQLSRDVPEARVRLLTFPVQLQTQAELYMVLPERERVMDVGPVRDRYFPQGTLWAQDLLKAGWMSDGSPVLVVPSVYKWFEAAGGEGGLRGEEVRSDNRFLSALRQTGVAVQSVSQSFMGGNIVVDARGDRLIAFVGGDALRRSALVSDLLEDSGNSSTVQTQQGAWARALGVQEVVFLDTGTSQPDVLFHLDQAMVPLGEGRMGVTRIVESLKNAAAGEGDRKDIQQAQAFLQMVRLTLEGLGYVILDMPVTPQEALRFQYRSNGVTYRDELTGQRQYLLPVFEGEDAGLRARTVRTLEAAGYRVREVPTGLNQNNGGLHCLVNVLL